MPVRIRTHLKDNLVAYVALFVALGGTAYATDNKDTVGSLQIKDGSVAPRDLAKSAKPVIYPKSLRGTDLRETDDDILAVPVSAAPRAYLVYARFGVNADSMVTGACTLLAGSDQEQVDFAGAVGQPQPVVTVMVMHRTTAAFTAKLRCHRTTGSTSVRLDDVKLDVIGIPG